MSQRRKDYSISDFLRPRRHPKGAVWDAIISLYLFHSLSPVSLLARLQPHPRASCSFQLPKHVRFHLLTVKGHLTSHCPTSWHTCMCAGIDASSKVSNTNDSLIRVLMWKRWIVTVVGKKKMKLDSNVPCSACGAAVAHAALCL